jgi:hypothetical protein
MITFLSAEAALLAAAAACRKRAKVLRSLAVHSPDYPGIRLLTRTLGKHTVDANAFDRRAAARTASLIREFVHTDGFETLLASGIAYLRGQLRKRGYK